MEAILKSEIISDRNQIKAAIEKEYARTGGIFRLAPAWVARPGIVQPGRRIKLKNECCRQNLSINERWLSSVTYSDNGIYNGICPEDHGLSYITMQNGKILLRDAMDICPEIMTSGRPWDVLPKFFDNWHRIPFHIHPCDRHLSPGLKGKPESYHFPVELNINRNAHPMTAMGVDPFYTDPQILNYLNQYLRGDNHLTDIGNTINLIPGTGYFMPPCTLHAPGSLVTYELQAASDVSSIAESKVNDMPMPPDMLDRDIPVKAEKDGMEAVSRFILEMIHCENSGNRENFREEYFRPPVGVFGNGKAEQSYVIYRCGKASEPKNPDLYSAKRTQVMADESHAFSENAAFGVITLRGHGCLCVPGKEPVALESASMYDTRDECYADEAFVSASAARAFSAQCESREPLAFYQHFASGSNPESAALGTGEYFRF